MSTHFYRSVILLSCLSLAVAGCDRGAAESNQPGTSAGADGSRGSGRAGGASGGGRGRGGAGGPVPVTTAKVESKSVPVTIPAVGTAEAISTVQVRAQVTGQLGQVHFTEGQEVRKGQLLFTIDPRPFETALQQAQAVLARDTATANNAQAQNARYEDLFKRGLIPRDQYETQRASSQSLQATLEADRANVENAKLNLSYTRVTAPIGGRTGSLSVHAGDLIRANDTTALVTINQVSPIYVTFSVPGRYLGEIRRYQAQKPLLATAQGQAAVAPGAQAPPPSVATPDMPAPQTQVAAGQGATAAVTPGPVETGRVTFIDNTVDPATGTIKLKASFDNKDQGLWPGLFVQVTLAVSVDQGAIVVPAAAVQPSASGQYVYVVKADHTAEVRPVTVSRQLGEEMIIAQGLTPGEEVVTDGQLRLTPGAQVTTRGQGRAGANSADQRH
jgi:multidrug efflux system membrane fusion protein